MVLRNNRASVSAINAIMVDNNKMSIVSCLKSNGIGAEVSEDRIILINKLESVFNSNKNLWVSIIKCFKYNPSANNYTTDSRFQSSLRETSVSVNPSLEQSKIDFGSIFTQIGDFFGGSSTSSGGSTSTTTQPAVSPTIAAIVTLVVVSVIGLIIWKA